MQTGNQHDSQFGLMVLSVLADQPAYGYLIQKRIGEASGGKVSLSEGTLYGLLQRLELQGAISSWWEKAGGRDRKWYKLTAAGRKTLDRQTQRWRDQAECLWRLLSPGQAGPAAPAE